MDERPNDDTPAPAAATADRKDTETSHEEPVKSPTKKKAKCVKPKHKNLSKSKKSRSRNKKTARDDSDSSSDNDSDEDDSDDDDTSDTTSSEEEVRKKRLAKSKARKKASRRRRKSSKKQVSESDDDISEDEVRVVRFITAPSARLRGSVANAVQESDTSSEDEKRRRKSKKSRKASETESEDASDEGGDVSTLETQVRDLVSKVEALKTTPKSKSSSKRRRKSKKSKKASETESEDASDDGDDFSTLETQVRDLMTKIESLKTKSKSSPSKRRRSSTKSSSSSKRKSSRKADSLQYKRVDQVWDSETYNYKLKESAEDDDGEFAEYAFLVRRRFDCENVYQDTVIDIKSKRLRTVLAEIMKDCKSVSLEAEEPTIDPNLLFLYLEELRTHYKKTLRSRIKTEKKKKTIKKLEQQKTTCKILVNYIDKDYADTKKTLYPLLQAGNITFDLLWALFTPNDIAITSCYGAWDEPRCFKVDFAMKHSSMMRGSWYDIEGKYMEYDGKGFGYGDFQVDIDSFKGPRKITSLAAYPLKYHKDPAGVKKQIVARGQRFVSMEGMQYKSHKGLAFMKKKKQVLKININGRVIIDPATFRRVNPNYLISVLRSKDSEDLFGPDSSDDDCSCCGSDSEREDAVGGNEVVENDEMDGGERAPKYKYKWVNGEHYVAVEVDEHGEPILSQGIDKIDQRSYTEEQLLLTSPVVLGFAFSEKLWLEFSLSGVHDIQHNDDAYDSLVLPDDKKATVRALVESYKFHPAKAIDDVIQGKGKGLVFVLHGSPGTGKTLTAESVSELLRCPLYIVSAGELGTDPVRLEQELQKILDIAHSWGAILLLDEADVFLEKREVHDIHRNALVSIFLRLLEYFQGILFLTTNRVETFDEAFQSRIHVALRYDELTPKSRKEIWMTFIERVRRQTVDQVGGFTDEEFNLLSRHKLNGRQIKNMVRTAQALAINEGKQLNMTHIKRVLDVAETFDRDLKGGSGYLDAMRSYT
jgi:hypothetical protein